MRVLQKKRGRCNNAKRCLNIIGVLGGERDEGASYLWVCCNSQRPSSDIFIWWAFKCYKNWSSRRHLTFAWPKKFSNLLMLIYTPATQPKAKNNPNFSSTLNGHKLSNKAQLLVVRSSLSMPAKRQTEMCVINNHQRAHQQRTLRQSRAEPTNYVVTCKQERSPSFWQFHSRVSNRIMWHATLAFSGCRPSYIVYIFSYQPILFCPFVYLTKHCPICCRLQPILFFFFWPFLRFVATHSLTFWDGFLIFLFCFGEFMLDYVHMDFLECISGV